MLLYSQKKFVEAVDFVALEIKDGMLYYSYDLGTGAASIISNDMRYDDNMLHNVRSNS